MPNLIFPSGTPLAPKQFSAPADGDPANAASVNTVFLPILDGLTFARRALFGRKLPTRCFIPSGLNGAPGVHAHMSVYALGPIVLTTGGGDVWQTYNHNTVTDVDLTAAWGGADLTAKTRFYLYFYLSAGSPAWVVTTDLPSVDLCYRGTNTDYAYVATFFTSSIANNVWYQRTMGGWTTYADQGFSLLSGGAATSWTQFDAFNTGDGSVTPYYTRHLLLYVSGRASGGGGDNVYLSSEVGGSGSYGHFCRDTGPSYFDPPVFAPDQNGALWYKWFVGGLLDVNVRGWYDPRG